MKISGSRPSDAMFLRLTINDDDARRRSFVSQLDLTLKTEMAPITAAAMEQGAYERSYAHIVKLQGHYSTS